MKALFRGTAPVVAVVAAALLRAAEDPASPQPPTAEEIEAQRSVGPRSAKVEPWRALFRGIEHATAQTDRPRPLRAHIVKIDLAEPTVEFFVTPSNGEKPLDTSAMRTSTFLKTSGCQLAINASPYQPMATAEGQGLDVLGLSASRGDVYSREALGYGALMIGKDNKARIETPPFKATDTYNAVGGFGLLLKDGANVADDDALHPRTAAGISQDGRWLYLLVIDGRQASWSEGTSTAETAAWIRHFGAHEAVNLDGGGSTTLVVADAKGGATVLNRPIHAGVPGRERITANHLGVFAKPCER